MERRQGSPEDAHFSLPGFALGQVDIELTGCSELAQEALDNLDTRLRCLVLGVVYRCGAEGAPGRGCCP